MTKSDNLASADKSRLGKQAYRRLEAALLTLIDGEGALKKARVSDSALSEVCDGLRDLLGDRW